MSKNKQGDLVLGAGASVESYLPIHESGHLAMGEITKNVFNIDSEVNPYKTNFGDTKVVELLEKAGFLPNNDSLKDWNNDGVADLSYSNYLKELLNGKNHCPPLGYAHTWSNNTYADKAILAGGHAGVLGTAAIFGYLGKKLKNLPMKIYSSAMSLAPTLQGIKDYITHNGASDIARLSEMTGVKEASLLGLLGLGTASILSYNWGTEIKDVLGSVSKKVENIYKAFTRNLKPTSVAT